MVVVVVRRITKVVVAVVVVMCGLVMVAMRLSMEQKKRHSALRCKAQCRSILLRCPARLAWLAPHLQPARRLFRIARAFFATGVVLDFCRIARALLSEAFRAAACAARALGASRRPSRHSLQNYEQCDATQKVAELHMGIDLRVHM